MLKLRHPFMEAVVMVRDPPLRFRRTGRFEPPLSKDELANLACCEDVDSRIVRGGVDVSSKGQGWEVQFGPFEEEVSLFHIGSNAGCSVTR